MHLLSEVLGKRTCGIVNHFTYLLIVIFKNVFDHKIDDKIILLFELLH